MCLMGNMDLLCMQSCRIWPHLAARAKSHGFSRGAAGTWHMISSYSGDVCSAMCGPMSSYEGHVRNILKVLQGNTEVSRGEP